MLQIFRKFLITLLAMLQLCAPLVHAHTGSSHLSLGLHIPGLESYRTDNHAAIGQQVNINNSGLDNEGLLIVVDAGIKNPHDAIPETGQGNFAVLPAKHLQSLIVCPSDYRFYKCSQEHNLRKQFSPPSLRAPPELVSYA